MRTVSRREMLASAAGIALAVAGRRSLAVDPPARTGRPVIRAGIAAYSYRDRLTAKMAPAMNLHDFVRTAAQMGWDGVELTSYYFPDPLPDGYLQELKRLCFLLGVDVSASSVGNVFTHPAGPARDSEIAKVRTWLHRAADLGAPVLRVFAGAPQPGQTAEEAERACIECLEICAETAAATGVMLALENHGGIVGTADGMLRILKAVRSPWCGANLDTGNFRTEDPYHDIERCAPYAVTTHLKTEVAPGVGPRVPADITRIVRILARAGYRGYLTLEYEGTAPVDEAAPATLSRIRAAVAEVLGS